MLHEQPPRAVLSNALEGLPLSASLTALRPVMQLAPMAVLESERVFPLALRQATPLGRLQALPLRGTLINAQAWLAV